MFFFKYKNNVLFLFGNFMGIDLFPLDQALQIHGHLHLSMPICWVLSMITPAI